MATHHRLSTQGSSPQQAAAAMSALHLPKHSPHHPQQQSPHPLPIQSPHPQPSPHNQQSSPHPQIIATSPYTALPHQSPTPQPAAPYPPPRPAQAAKSPRQQSSSSSRAAAAAAAAAQQQQQQQQLAVHQQQQHAAQAAAAQYYYGEAAMVANMAARKSHTNPMYRHDPAAFSMFSAGGMFPTASGGHHTPPTLGSHPALGHASAARAAAHHMDTSHAQAAQVSFKESIIASSTVH